MRKKSKPTEEDEINFHRENSLVHGNKKTLTESNESNLQHKSK